MNTEKIKKAIVTISSVNNENPNLTSIGTGFFVHKDGYIITCSHVIDGADNIIAKDCDLNELPCEILFNDNYKDFCILKIDKEVENFLELGNFSNINDLDEVIICAASEPIKTFFPLLRKGYVSGKGSIGNRGINVVQLDMPIMKGNSGSPLLALKNNRVIGLVSNRYGKLKDNLSNFRDNIYATTTTDPGLYLIADIINEQDRLMDLGIGYAISIDYIKDSLNNLINS